MLKRSFAEFHAQKAQPESLEAVEKGQAALASVRAQPFPEAFLGSTKQDVMDYHHITEDIDDLSKDLQVALPSYCRMVLPGPAPGALWKLSTGNANPHAVRRLSDCNQFQKLEDQSSQCFHHRQALICCVLKTIPEADGCLNHKV